MHNTNMSLTNFCRKLLRASQDELNEKKKQPAKPHRNHQHFVRVLCFVTECFVEMFLLNFVVNQKKTIFPQELVAHKTNHLSYRCRSRRNRLLSRTKQGNYTLSKENPAELTSSHPSRIWPHVIEIVVAFYQFVREISRARFNFLIKLPR